MKRVLLLLPVLFGMLSLGWLANPALAQGDSTRKSVQYHAELGGLAAMASRTPLWLRANQFGTVPLTAPAGTIRVGSTGLFGRRATSGGWFMGYGLDVVGNAASTRQVLLPEAYAKIGVGAIELVAGRRKEVLGLVDSTLSSGSYSWSGNALPITKIQLGTRGFAPIGFTKGVVAINAFIAHGWFPNTDSIQNSYLHQKAIYMRIGKPGWRVKVYAGLLHNAQWGGQSKYISAQAAKDGVLPSSLKTYWYVVTARQPDESVPDQYTQFDAVNRFGNHLGSIDVATEINLNRWNLFAYYQHPYEDKSGLAFQNMPDGLYGLRLRRQPGQATRSFRVTRLLVEVLSTMDQSGPLVHTGAHYDGQDDYFNNYQYLNGWAVNRQILGTPLLALRADVQPQWQNKTGNTWAVVSNRVQAVYAGLTGEFPSGLQVLIRASFANHYGTYRVPFPEKATQFSGICWLTWPLPRLNGLQLRAALAVDQGTLYQNSTGGWLSLRKVW